ncbi:hypothetical protein [Paenibacillus xerothermodurans]|uniref:Uncharacterized protein n=1 Tax=Paenibacillus xerothermodurans TaxID=1977292 RepID=A0A2W1P1Q8_PAEXE|nr:hypothetical protein [Paenibacillus xerothermodurans]PZE21692.1 hypothetical protein CBW46_004530 [Paenibacillus xerothermodurans]
MKYTVQYVPISKIMPGPVGKLTKRTHELRKAAQDCMHLLIVRKNKKNKGYIIVSGHNHYEYLKRHTRNKLVPCLVDGNKLLLTLSTLVSRLQLPMLPNDARDMIPTGSSWTIIKSFLKQEPRFRRLSRRQQIRVLRLGLQYKSTTLSAMRAKVDDLLR